MSAPRLHDLNDLVIRSDVARRVKKSERMVADYEREDTYPPVLVRVGRSDIRSWKAVRAWYKSNAWRFHSSS